MKNSFLNIVSFTVPFPANYGGVIDVFYKIKALKNDGVNVILHCFTYGRKQAVELEEFCYSVHYYERTMNPLLLFNQTPFIVLSRSSDLLEKKLLENNYPILLEGLHSCSILKNKAFLNRKIIIRSHNIEHHYYQHLGKSEKNFLKKWYFMLEAKKLKKYEKLVFPKAFEILGISEKDTQYLQQKYHKGIWVSAFHQFEEVKISSKSKQFAYYHGNLEISENNEAALFLVNEVFNQINYPLVIAGNNPSSELVSACKNNKNVTLFAGISSEKIISLLEEAQINILPTFQNTGIKLKLLAALFHGKHCLVNPPMVEGTGLESLCHLANSSENFIEKIKLLKDNVFSKHELDNRNKTLHAYSNTLHVKKITAML